MAEKIWNKFAKDIKNLIPSIDITIVNKLKSNFFNMPADYFSSKKCSDLMADTLKNINENKLKVYIHLLEFKKTMKNNKKMKRRNPKVISAVESKKTKVFEEASENLPNIKLDQEIFVIEECIKNDSPSTKLIDDSYLNLSPDASQSKSNENLNKVNKDKIEKYIAKLEIVLQATKEQIEKFEEQELSLDDLDNENSSFVLLDKLKSHYVKVWKKISKLRDTNSNLHKQYLKSFNFTGSNYPDLNEEINNFVKKKKFPDYYDIKSMIFSYNNKNTLKLSVQKINEMAADIFTQIGNQLKKLRINEFVQYFGNHLTDQVKLEKDPMIYDEQLRKILHKNYVQGEVNLDNVIKSFVTMQENGQILDNDSDISTEHSVDSEKNREEEAEIVENSITFTGSENQNDLIIEKQNNEQILIENNENAVESKSSKVNLLEISFNEMFDENVASYVKIASNSLIDDLMFDSNVQNPNQKPSEEYLNEISSTTFQFNVEQMKHGDKSKYYKETIILNSDDDSNESDVYDSEDDEDKKSRYTYSCKLNDYIMSHPKPKKPEIKEILINLDDEDEDDIILIDPSISENQKVVDS